MRLTMLSMAALFALISAGSSDSSKLQSSVRTVRVELNIEAARS